MEQLDETQISQKSNVGRPRKTQFNPKDLNARSMHFCFTWFYENNKPEEVLKRYYDNNDDLVVFILGGYEICPSTQKKHIQGYIQLNKKKTFKVFMKEFQTFIKNKCHMQMCMGSSEQNKFYCEKEGNVFSFGDIQDIISKYQKVNDDREKRVGPTKVIKSYYENGGDSLKLIVKEAADNVSAIKYAESLHKYYDKPRGRHDRVRLSYYYGLPGTGKTFSASKELDDDKKAYYVKDADKPKWWDQYDGEKYVIIDDLRDKIDFGSLLNIVNPSPYLTEFKGGSRQLKATDFVITTNYTPTGLYNDELYRKESMMPLLRRMNKIRFYESFKKYYEFNAPDDVNPYDIQFYNYAFFVYIDNEMQKIYGHKLVSAEFEQEKFKDREFIKTKITQLKIDISQCVSIGYVPDETHLIQDVESDEDTEEDSEYSDSYPECYEK